MEFSPIEALVKDLLDYNTDLVIGYHLRDAERVAKTAQSMVVNQLQRVRKYYEIMGSLPNFPFLSAFLNEEGNLELGWMLSDKPHQQDKRWLKSGYLIRNLDNYLKAVEEPTVCEEIFYEELKKARTQSLAQDN